MGEFGIVFRLLGLGVVMGIGNMVLRQLGREDLANIANIIAIVIGISMIVRPVIAVFQDVIRVFNIF